MSYNASQRKSPIANNLDNDSYATIHDGFEYRFSSLRNKEKFDSLLFQRIEWLNDSLSRRFHVPVKADHLAAVQLYQMCEGRGFRVIDIVLDNEAVKADDVSVYVSMYVGK